MELLVFPARERLVPVKQCCRKVDLGLAYIFLLHVFIPTHIRPDQFEPSAVNNHLEVAKIYRHRACAVSAFPQMAGLPSAPLRCINLLTIFTLDKASFAPGHDFGSLFLEFFNSPPDLSPVVDCVPLVFHLPEMGGEHCTTCSLQGDEAHEL